MEEKEFFSFCIEQYREQQSQADAIYQRVGVLLAALPVLGAVAYKLGRPELLPITFTRVDIFLYIAFSFLTFIGIALSILFLVLSICPRTYKALPPMREWNEWRVKYGKNLSQAGEKAGDRIVSTECQEELKKKVIEAEEQYQHTNEARRKWFKGAILCAALSIGTLGLQATMHLMLYLQRI
jgi:hypothetical protein